MIPAERDHEWGCAEEKDMLFILVGIISLT